MRRKRWGKDRKHWIHEQKQKGMYIIPTLFTVSNIFCGFWSVSNSILGNYELAALLVGIAMILDTLDGRIARLTKTTSEFGVQLDSLADVITFGIAPAVLCYQWAFSDFEVHPIARAGWLACFVYLVSAASRLARFNVQSAGVPDKRYFTGLPTPPSAGFVAATIYCFPERLQGNIPPLVAFCLMLLLAFLMVSKVKYRSFKDLNLRQPRSYRITAVFALIIFALALDLKKSLITLATLYVASGMIGYLLHKRRRPVPAPAPPPPPEQQAPAVPEEKHA